MVSGTELDLIAMYIKNGFKIPKPSAEEANQNCYMIHIDGYWDEYQQSKLLQSKLEFEKESYFIDGIVREMIIQNENGDRLAKMFYQLNRIQRSEFAKQFLTWHGNSTLGVPQDREVEFRRAYSVFGGIKFVLVYFNDKITQERLNYLMNLTLMHFNYLLDFKTDEIGIVGVSNSFKRYAFAYSGSWMQSPPAEIISALEEGLKQEGWKLRSEFTMPDNIQPLI